LDIDFNKIRSLREEIAKLLKERPEFIPLQKEIDLALEKAGNNKMNRCAVIQNMMLTKWMEIVPAAKDLQGVMGDIKKGAKKPL